MEGERGETVAVVPLRDGTSGKSRLAVALDAGARRRLVAALAERVLGVLVSTPAVSRVVVVTADPPFVDGIVAAVRAGSSSAPAASGVAPPALDVLPQSLMRPGLNAGLDAAREHVVATHPSARLLVVHADLPALTVADVEALLATRGGVVLAPDTARSGTNAVAVDASEGFSFRFGVGSLAAHRREAWARGLDVAVVERPGSGLDLDTARDWAALPPAVRREVEEGARRW